MKNIPVIAIAVLAFVGCAKEAVNENNLGREVKFAASFDETKTILTGGNGVNWNVNDPVSIFDGSSIVQAKASADGATADLTATLSTDGPWYAIYPHDASATISGDVITTKVLKETTAKANTFAKKVNVSIARSTPDNRMVFKNILSYFKFQLTQDNIYSVTLKADGGELLAGNVQICYNDGVPQTTVVSGGSSTVTLLPSTGQPAMATTYCCFIGFVPTTFTQGFTLIIQDTFGSTYEVRHDAPFTAERSTIYNIGNPDSDIVIDEAIVFEDADVEAAVVAAFGGGRTAGKIYKSEAAAVTFAQMQAFTFTNSANVNKFNELKYFTGLYADPVPGETRTGYCIPDGFFNGFTALEEVTLPANITEIRPNTFKGCTALKSIEIPATVAGIYSSAFESCTALGGKLTIPSGVKSVTNNAFKSCGNITELELPTTLTKVGQYAFYGFQKAKKVIVPDSITSLGIQAFWALRAATCVGPAGTPEGHLVTPSKVPEIGQMCFCDEYYLHTMNISNGPTTLGDRAFRKFGINVASGTPIVGYVPASVTSIAAKAFEASAFTEVHFAGTTPPILGGNPFNNAVHYSDGTLKIYVPASAVATYKAESSWSTIKNFVFAEE